MDLDFRLADLWIDVSRAAPDAATSWAYMRMAYGMGYVDALTEPARGQLCRDHGFAVPERRRC
jgi:hypothetical protein